MRLSDVFVVTDYLSDPGNLGTILRTMDSQQSAGLMIVGQSTDPHHPRTVRASRGTVFTVPLYQTPDIETTFKWAEAHHVQTITTSANVTRSFWDVDYRLPVLCIFGNENRGLDARTMRMAARLVTFPMDGTVSSVPIRLRQVRPVGNNSTQ